MYLNIICMSCREHILQAESETLTSPMRGDMFVVKQDMEWWIFAPEAMGLDLVCPLCENTFYLKHGESERIRVQHPDNPAIIEIEAIDVKDIFDKFKFEGKGGKAKVKKVKKKRKSIKKKSNIDPKTGKRRYRAKSRAVNKCKPIEKKDDNDTI